MIFEKKRGKEDQGSPRLTGLRAPEVVSDGGGGFRMGAGALGVGGLSRPLTQPSSPPSQVRLPPSDARAVGQSSLGRRGVWWG